MLERLSPQAAVVAKQVNQLPGEVVSVVAMEELAELQQAISKAARGKLDRHNLTEEIADVLICVDWLMARYGLTPAEVFDWKAQKIARCEQRLTDGTFK